VEAVGRPVVHFEVNGRDGQALGRFFKESLRLGPPTRARDELPIMTPGEGPASGIGQVEHSDQMWVNRIVDGAEGDAGVEPLQHHRVCDSWSQKPRP